MKKILLILSFVIIPYAFSQGVQIEPAPLSVEDDGARKIINRSEGDTTPVKRTEDVVPPPPAEALIIPNDDVVNPPVLPVQETKVEAQKIAIEVIPVIDPASKQSVPVNPLDGQLNLDEPSQTTNVEPATPSHSMVDDDLFPKYRSHSLKKYLQFSFGFLDSHYKKIHPTLDNGSTMMSFKFVADMSSSIQSGFAVEVLNDKSAQTIPDNIRVLQYRVFVDYHAPLLSKEVLRLDWIGSFGFSVGDFGIRRRYANSEGQEVSVKLKDGIIAGLIPAMGVRFYLFNQNSFDIMLEYHQYFGTPQRHIGGLAIAPRLSFEF